jgi:hypothetical protein
MTVVRQSSPLAKNNFINHSKLIRTFRTAGERTVFDDSRVSLQEREPALLFITRTSGQTIRQEEEPEFFFECVEIDEISQHLILIRGYAAALKRIEDK